MEKVSPDSTMYFNRVNPDLATQIRELAQIRREKEEQMAKALEGCHCTNIAHHDAK